MSLRVSRKYRFKRTIAILRQVCLFLGFWRISLGGFLTYRRNRWIETLGTSSMQKPLLVLSECFAIS